PPPHRALVRGRPPAAGPPGARRLPPRMPRCGPATCGRPSRPRGSRTGAGAVRGRVARAPGGGPRRPSRSARSAFPAPPRSQRIEMDAQLLSRRDVQHLAGVAAVDRDRHRPVGVLVEDDVAAARVREGARGDDVVALAGELELDLTTGLDTRLLEVLAPEVELHVAEAVDVENRRPDAGAAQVRLGQVETGERLLVERRPELLERHAEREMR